VVAAAVILDPNQAYPGVGESKKLSASEREKALEVIVARAWAWAWAGVEAGEVDRLNPLRAALLAMRRAVAALAIRPALVLVDGNVKPDLEVPARTLVRGDGRSLSIGAASILAKVTRDRLMLEWHGRCPQYGFDQHKGYGTKKHYEDLRHYGHSPCHRLSFRGVRPESGALAGLDFEAQT
jgi:ribonuclease HII